MSPIVSCSTCPRPDLVRFPPAGRSPARDRHAEGNPQAGLHRQALFALAWFRDKGDIPRLGRGFGLPQSTAYRYLDEVIHVLAARAPGLQEQLERALAAEVPYLILDGKVVDTDRCRRKPPAAREDDRLVYAGKTHDFGGNIQALFYPSGIPLWVSDVLPGNVHDLAAARENVLACCGRSWTPYRCWPIPVRRRRPRRPRPGEEAPVKSWTLIPGPQCAAAVGALPGERGFALLTQRWRTLQHVTASPANRSHSKGRICPDAIRAQDDHVKVVEKRRSCRMACCASRSPQAAVEASSMIGAASAEGGLQRRSVPPVAAGVMPRSARR